ncbi:hypothetical protein NHX12_032024 [Muraenolepis orangiensis]|uniref:Uncharacterized protein n=1 Tax=Muraenolepis orangiensis TaxID=630683 RepID=A0A9Q0E848_9TELE|nr:hypothetical protein NHX12_032024 [Muraenolepis orangiensis]
MGSRQESWGAVRSHGEPSGVMVSRQESWGAVRSHEGADEEASLPCNTQGEDQPSKSWSFSNQELRVLTRNRWVLTRNRWVLTRNRGF